MNRRIMALTAITGNLGNPGDRWLCDHASVYCELEGGASAIVEGQRMLPATKGSDYRMTVAGSKGYLDLVMGKSIAVTTENGLEQAPTNLPAPVSVVADWLNHGSLIPQDASLRANHLAICATLAAERHERLQC